MDNVVKYPIQVREYKVWNDNVGIVSILLGITIICAVAVLLLLFSFDFAQRVLLVWIAFFVYAILLLVLLRPSRVREVRKNIVMSTDKPVVEKKIEVPAIKDNEEMFIDVPKSKAEVPHYEYVGSMQTRTYHLRNCRLARLVKSKYKLSNNSVEFFKKRKFKACKICVLKKKKA